MNKMQFQPYLSMSLLVVLILSGCAPATPIPVQTQTPAGVRFEPADCVFGNATGMECGYVSVPVDRSQPDGAQIKLAVAIVRSSSSNPAPDPVLLLFSWLGGAGNQIMEAMPALPRAFGGILAKRDLIVFDQRGVEYSSPVLECPEVESQALEDATQNLSPAEEQKHSLQATRACHARLVKNGINLSAYNSAASAADINDLRMALGYAEWNILGDAYGTRLALTVMRDFPAGVRSVILDSVYPPQANLDTEAAANAERALNLLFERCAADSKCNEAYPDLKSVFYDTATQLDTDPITFEQVSNRTQQTVKVLINGDRLTALIIHLLTYDYLLPNIPKWIYEFHDGNVASDPMLPMYMYYFTFQNEITSEGMRLSVQCGEESSFSSAQAIEAADAAVEPRLAEAVNQGWTYAMCSAWDVKAAAAIENQAVVSDIPTLILTGDNDPGTSPAWAKSTAENLSKAYAFEFPWASHGLIYGVTPAAYCAQRMMSDFIDLPIATPASTCMDGLKVSFETK